MPEKEESDSEDDSYVEEEEETGSSEFSESDDEAENVQEETESQFVCGQSNENNKRKRRKKRSPLSKMKSRHLKENRKRKAMTTKEKLEVINKVEGQGWKQVQVCNNYGLTKSTVATILKSSEQLKNSLKEKPGLLMKTKNRTSKFSPIDTALWSWFTQIRGQNGVVGDDLLREKAMKFSFDLKLLQEGEEISYGYVDRFKRDFKISFQKVSGEENAVDMNVVRSFFDGLPKALEGYLMDDVFNVDETGLCVLILLKCS